MSLILGVYLWRYEFENILLSSVFDGCRNGGVCRHPCPRLSERDSGSVYLQKQDGNGNWVTIDSSKVVLVSSDNDVPFAITSPGIYRFAVYGDDDSSNGNLIITLKDIKGQYMSILLHVWTQLRRVTQMLIGLPQLW